MAKKFKYSLEGYLKINQFEEKKIKSEIGEILSEINKLKREIEEINRGINETYHSMEKATGESASGRFLHYFPMFVEGAKEDIQNKENLIYALERRYRDKLLELERVMGKVKAVENHKDKKKREYDKMVQKKQQEEIDEIISVRRHFKKGEV